ncbi:MAG TPA: alpha/beta hydrolase [Streptosporangiaceae bacterium]|nr:alpha/beta hydrolase [Streptosporangiaceae bacterium]
MTGPDDRDWQAFTGQWRRSCATDAQLLAMGAAATVAFLVRCGDRAVAFVFERGRLGSEVSTRPEADFEVSAAAPVWERFWQPMPRPPYQSLFSMLARVPGVKVSGDQLRFAQHAHLVRRILEIGRTVRCGGEALETGPLPPAPGGPEPVTGHYRLLTIGEKPTRVYYEEAGEGRDVILLHTAGADARQWYHVMNDPRLLRRCHMVAFDLPWHGRSMPPRGMWPGSYALTTSTYATTVEALADALSLDRPLVVGCSMGGQICLELAYRSPGRFAAVIACEASDHVTGRQVGWAKDPRVNQALFVPEWVYGLMAPQSPAEYRDEVWWEYSQGGFGTYHGDISFYSGEWDARLRVGDIDTGRCPVFMLTGEYDYSCTPEMSRHTAAKIPGARFQMMHGVGHFPMAENPPVFIDYLLPVLDEIDGLGGAGPGGPPRREPADGTS